MAKRKVWTHEMVIARFERTSRAKSLAKKDAKLRKAIERCRVEEAKLQGQRGAILGKRRELEKAALRKHGLE